MHCYRFQLLNSLVVAIATGAPASVGMADEAPKQANWPAVAESEARPPTERHYHNGPLRIDDFRGEPNDATFGQAYTDVQVKFVFEYQVDPVKQRNRNPPLFDARLTKVRTYAVFMPESSWWKGQHDARLLDHEQGHFDLAEICARRLQHELSKLLTTRQSIRSRGTTQQIAVNGLAEKLNRMLNEANELAIQSSKDYDQQTRHGAHERLQAEHRRVQSLLLKQLAESAETEIQRTSTP